MNQTLEIQLKGDNINTESFTLGELGAMLSGLETALYALVVEDHPHLKGQKIQVSLVEVQSGSVAYQFSPQLKEPVEMAFRAPLKL